MQHQVCIAFPAARTLQKQLPRPQISLRESEQATWIASAMAQQLEMPASSLCVDYAQTGAVDGWRVTAAQRLDVNLLCRLASRLKLRVVGIVPDASALSAFLHGNLMTFRGWPGVTKRAGFGPPPIAGDAVRAATLPLFQTWYPG